MRRIVGALSGLAVMVAAVAMFAGDGAQEVGLRMCESPVILFTPEQHEFAIDVLDELGEVVLQAIQPLLSSEDSAIAEAAHVEVLLDEIEMGEFRALLKPELLFLQKVCDLTEPEYQSIRRSCDESLREVVEQFVAEQEQREQAENVGEKSSIEPKPLPLRIQKSVARIAECQLTPEQWSRYSAEFQLRSAHRKQVAILNLVARLDHDLLLTSKQRERFAKVLDENWRESWSQSLGAFAGESNFMPRLAQDDMRPILSPAQFEVLIELSYDDEVANWGDNSVDWFIDEMVDEVMADEEMPANGKAPQEPNALESDQ